MASQLEQMWRTLNKNNYLFIKLGISVLLVGLAFSLVHNRSSHSSAVSTSPFLSNTAQIPIKESTIREEKCDLFHGEWVAYEGEPLYTNMSCGFIEDHQNCMKNGRPDTGYLRWRWSPHGCDLPRLDPRTFLELMRGKSWAFIGDSISRNHVQSFLCVLSKAKSIKWASHAVYPRLKRPSKFTTTRITDLEDGSSRCTTLQSRLSGPLSLLKLPFSKDMNGASSSEIELHLDTLDSSWTEQYNSFDYVILSSGKWFTKFAIYYENEAVLGCHRCSNKNFTELGFDLAYRRVMRTVLDYILSSNHKGMIFYRTSTPDHFEGGEWFSGGTCKRESPVKEGEFELSVVDKILCDVEVEEFEKISAKASENGVNLRLFDVAPMSLLRPDGHPGPYRFYQPLAKDKNAKTINDCLHWCLPGPIDSWNDVLMEIIVNSSKKLYAES